MTPKMEAPEFNVIEGHEPGSLDWRKKITATKARDILAPHLGYESFGTPLSTWVDLTAALRGEESTSNEDTAFMQWGRATETANRQLMAVEMGTDIDPSPGMVQDSEFEWLASTPDGIARGGPMDGFGVWEGKSPTVWKRDEWEDGVPDSVLVQVLVNLRCTGLTWGCASALMPPSKSEDEILLHDHVVDNPVFSDRMMEILIDFWERNVMRDIPPEATGTKLDSQMLAQCYPQHEAKTVKFSDELAEILHLDTELDAEIKRLKKEREGVRNKIKLEMGDALYGSDGLRHYKWATIERHHKPKAAYVQVVRQLRKVKSIGGA